MNPKLKRKNDALQQNWCFWGFAISLLGKLNFHLFGKGWPE